jgi:HlyD family secretion protein
MANRSRRPWVNRAGVAGVAVIVGVAAGIGISQAMASGGSGYRTATATVATVKKTLTVGGTTQPEHQATAAFQVGGTISAVKVGQGQKVSAGQIIATLDSTELQQQVSIAQTNLAAAQAVLTENEAGQAAGSTGGSSAQTAAVVTGGATAVLTAAVGRPASGQTSLKQAQQAVVNGQHTADMDLQTAGVSLRNAETICSSASSPPPTTTPPPNSTSTTTTPTTTAPPSPTSTTAAPPTSSTTASATSAGLTAAILTSASASSSACTAALNQAMVAENQVSKDQQNLAAAETTLAQILSSQATAPTPSSGHTPSGPSSGGGSGTKQGNGTGGFSGSSSSGGRSGFSSSGASRSTGSGQTGGTGQTGGSQGSGGSFSNNASGASGAAVNSAQQLASDQATIDSDQAALVRAQQSLAEAQLTSPMAGTVAAVTLQAGQTVNAGSTDNAIQIINSGSYQTSASLTTSQVAAVKVGDPAQVTVDGTSGTLSGVVSRVGPVLVSGSTYSYPVVVELQESGSGIAAGSAGQVEIDLAQAANAVVVPTSAVHTTGAGRNYVTVLQAGKETTRMVTVGVVGATYTQILSGLSRGTTVVLADLSTPVPSSSSNLNTGRFGGLGGLGGGGGFGGRGGLGGGGGFPAGSVSRTPVVG